MNSIRDEAGHQPVFGKLLPDVVGMPPRGGVASVAQVRGECGAGAYGRGDRFRLGGGMADGRHHARAHDVLDVGGSFRPLGREGHNPDRTASRFLPALEFRDIGGTHPLARMRAARTVLRRDMRTLYVESVQGAAMRKAFAGGRQAGKSRRHALARGR